MTSAAIASACAEAGRSLIAVSQVVFLAVDCDDTRAAFGQQPDGRGSDDAGRAGDDGDPAIQTNSIGHAGFSLPSGSSGCPGFCWVRREGARTLIETDYFIWRAG